VVKVRWDGDGRLLQRVVVLRAHCEGGGRGRCVWVEGRGRVSMNLGSNFERIAGLRREEILGGLFGCLVSP